MQTETVRLNMFEKYPLIVRFILAIGISFIVLAILFFISIIGVSAYQGVGFDGIMNSISNPVTLQEISILRAFLFMQTTYIFGLFPVLMVIFLYRKPLEFLQINKVPDMRFIVAVIAIMILAIPFINLIAEFNKTVIDAIWGENNSMKQAEEAAERVTKALLSDVSHGGLWANLIVVALLPAICEEIFFRGALLKILFQYTKSPHWAILLSGVIFSLFHWQFYGFIPRAGMGIFFGYLLLYSGSLWLPIIAHFVNNALAVIVYYYINKNMLEESFENIGADSSTILIAIVCAISLTVAIFYLFRTKEIKLRIPEIR